MKPRKPKRTAYERVKQAYLEGHACHLTYGDCCDLYLFDTAFRDRADMDERNQTGPGDPRPFKGDAP